MNKTGKLARPIAGVSAATLISRLLGYARDMLIANFFGAGLIADAFFVAYRIPNLFRRLLGEGALSASFIPVFTDYLANKPEPESKNLVSIFSTLFLIVLLVLVGIGILIAPWIVTVIAPGFRGIPEKFKLTIELTRIMFPFMLAIGLSALALGILNSLRNFFIPALAPAILNLVAIGFLLTVCPLFEHPIRGLAIGIVAGGFAQFLFQFPSVVKRGYLKCPGFSLGHAGVKKIGLLMAPAAWGLSINQVNVFVDTICASLLIQGSVSALYYANRLMQLPLALFGTAAVTVALPTMSRYAAEQDLSGLKKMLLSSLRLTLFAVIPASVGLIVLGEPIVRLLFEHGKFTAQATGLTTWALGFYALGIFAFAGVRLFAAAFYALKDTATPVKIASLAMIVNIGLNILLMRFLAVGGLALATTLASGLNLGLLVILLRKRIGCLEFAGLLNWLGRVILASLGMGISVVLLAGYIGPEYKFRQVLIPLVLAVVVYYFLTQILQIEEVKYIKKIFAPKSY